MIKYLLCCLLGALIGVTITYIIMKRRGPGIVQNMVTSFDNMDGKAVKKITPEEDKVEVLDTRLEKNPTGIVNPGVQIEPEKDEVFSLAEDNMNEEMATYEKQLQDRKNESRVSVESIFPTEREAKRNNSQTAVDNMNMKSEENKEEDNHQNRFFN